jgi:hypothetical protein
VSKAAEGDRVLVRDLVERINAAHYWTTEVGVLAFICDELESGRVAAFSASDALPCADTSLVRGNPAQWYVTGDGEHHILRAIAERLVALSERYEKQLAEATASISDTETLQLHSVPSILYNNSDEPIWEEWAEYSRLPARQAMPLIQGLNPKFFAAKGPAFPPGRAREMSRAQEYFRICSHRIGVAEAADLDKLTPSEWLNWATERGWPVCEQFRAMVNLSAPPPNIEPDARRRRPQGTVKRQILDAIRKLGHDPKALPARDKRKRTKWVKGHVADLLKRPTKSLDRAWEQLRKDGHIAERTSPDYPPPKR